LVKTAAEAKEAARLFQEAREAEAAAKRKDAAAEAEAKRQRRGRGIDARLSDARMADLDEVSKRLRQRLQFLAAQRDKRGRGRWRRRHTSPAAASSAGQRGKRGRGHWRRQDRWPAAASSEELAAGSESQVALMLQAPGEAAGSFLMAPGEVFASLAVAVVDAQRATMRRRAQAWVRLRELVRKAASRFLTAPCEVFASLTVAHFGATAAQATQPAGSTGGMGASTGSFGASSGGMFDAVVATVTQVAPSCPQWAGQIFIQQAGRRTFLLHVTSDDTVASLKARLKWPDSRLIKSPLELWDDTRSLGSYGVRKEDTLLLCGRLCGGGVCMGKPTVVAPCKNIAPQDVAQKHAKLCMDASGLIKKGKFGGIDLFDSTLEGQVGYMDATALRGMYAEHCMDAASSNAPFSPPNNPGLECTPEGEFWYVVGKDGIDIDKWEVKPGARPSTYDGCMVEGRNATPLSELLEADEAKRAKLRDTELIALRLYSGKNSFAGRRYGGVVVSILLHLPFLAMP
jgi:hypothetical protein